MQNLDMTFAALSDGTRREILAQLVKGEARLSDLAEPFEMTQTAVSKHVRMLNDAGLVLVEKRGRTKYCTLSAHALMGVANWLADYEIFWADQFDNLAIHLASEEE